MERESGNKTSGSGYGDTGGSRDSRYNDNSGEGNGAGYYGNFDQNSGTGYYGASNESNSARYYGNSGGYCGNPGLNYDGYDGSDVNDDSSYSGANSGYDGYNGPNSGYYGSCGEPEQSFDGAGYYNGELNGGNGSYYNGVPNGGNGGYYNGTSNGGNGGYYNGALGGGNGGNYNVPPVGGIPGGEPPRKKKRKSRVGDVISIFVMVIAFGVFVFAGYKLYGYYKDYQRVDEEYANLATYTINETESEDLDALEADAENDDMQSLSGREVKTVEIDEEEVTLPVMTNPIDFESLKEVNSDIVGWLKIRALDLSYPVVQGEDNDYYLHRSFEQEDLFAGCLFVNFENKSDFTDQNTIIYGHNMKNGSMFGTLKNLRDEETYNTSKYFWVFTEDIIYLYRIISARVVDKVGQTYQIVFTEEEFEEFLNTAMEESEVDNSDVSVSTDDKIVTLSTCTGDSSTRFVVQGKLVQMYASR